uniref:trypsin-like peptidase domain-containing protein n=1 Tax=Gelidibacter sp. TaxID=2018083 RepID=UPI00404A6BC8
MKSLLTIHKSVKFIFLCIILVLFISCSEKKYTAEEIYSEFSPAVVLISHEFYYEANFNDFTFYFVPNPKESGLAIARTEQEAIENSVSINGTGFFINENGVIATNSHVAFPMPSEEEQSNIKEFFGNLKYEMITSLNELESKKNELEDIYYKKYDLLSFEDVNVIRVKLKEYSDEITEISNITSKLNYDKFDIKIDVKTISIKIGYNDTYIENSNDLSDCVKLIKSEEKDLALIQLKSKKTPIEIKPIQVANLTEKSNLDEKVYMVGFNSGFSLAQTKEGIKSQITSGNITQKSDGEKILYSIPTLSGSSGSPIINEEGKLIAINYAKRAEFQGFSFGVPVIHLVNLVDEKRIDGTNTMTISNSQNSTQKEKTNNNSETDSHSNQNNDFSASGIINGSNINVRPEANTNNTPLNFTLQLNQKVKILEFVDSSDSEFLLSKEVNCNVGGKMIRLNKGKSIIHLDCNDQTAMCKIRFYDGSEYLTGYIPEDSITEENGSWYKIETEYGQVGWVYSDFVSKI